MTRHYPRPLRLPPPRRRQYRLDLRLRSPLSKACSPRSGKGLELIYFDFWASHLASVDAHPCELSPPLATQHWHVRPKEKSMTQSLYSSS